MRAGTRARCPLAERDPVFALVTCHAPGRALEKLQGQGEDLRSPKAWFRPTRPSTPDPDPGEIAFSLDIRSQSPRHWTTSTNCCRTNAPSRRNRGVESSSTKDLYGARRNCAGTGARTGRHLRGDAAAFHRDPERRGPRRGRVLASRRAVRDDFHPQRARLAQPAGKHGPEDFILGAEVLHIALARKAGCASSRST